VNSGSRSHDVAQYEDVNEVLVGECNAMSGIKAEWVNHKVGCFRKYAKVVETA
jgi:hypothetical protein